MTLKNFANWRKVSARSREMRYKLKCIMAQDQVTEEIRRRADIVEIIGQYVQLKPAGGDNF